MTGDRRAGRRAFFGSLVALLLVALLLRLAGVLLADRMVADVLRYHKIASHVLDVSWNPYEAARLYPYPPLWIVFEVGAEWLARALGGGFPILVKIPVVAADLGIVWLLARAGAWRRETGDGDANAQPALHPIERAHAAVGGTVGLGEAGHRGLLAAWIYALHPVALLVTGFHGQFDSLAVFAVLISLVLHEARRRDASALALALGIATKSYPVLLLPFFLLAQPDLRKATRFLLLATVPVGVLLLPFALANAPALQRELFGYGGIADFGWIGLARASRWAATGVLSRSEAIHWPVAVAWGKLAFLASWLGLLAICFRRRREISLVDACLAVLLAFLGLYGAVSAQYLLWVVPLALLRPDWHSLAFGATATLALLGFYPFLAPGVVFPAPAGGAPSNLFGLVWALGVALLLGETLAWLGATFVRLCRRDHASSARLMSREERP